MSGPRLAFEPRRQYLRQTTLSRSQINLKKRPVRGVGRNPVLARYSDESGFLVDSRAAGGVRSGDLLGGN